jgi:hypothetical protein
MNEETVTITKSEYEQLIRRECLISALEAVGVDNWQGWGEHREIEDELLKGHGLTQDE